MLAQKHKSGYNILRLQISILYDDHYRKCWTSYNQKGGKTFLGGEASSLTESTLLCCVFWWQGCTCEAREWMLGCNVLQTFMIREETLTRFLAICSLQENFIRRHRILKQQVSPGVIAGIVVVVVLILGYFAFKASSGPGVATENPYKGGGAPQGGGPPSSVGGGGGGAMGGPGGGSMGGPGGPPGGGSMGAPGGGPGGSMGAPGSAGG